VCVCVCVSVCVCLCSCAFSGGVLVVVTVAYSLKGLTKRRSFNCLKRWSQELHCIFQIASLTDLCKGYKNVSKQVLY
jgi:hypothetical protein